MVMGRSVEKIEITFNRQNSLPAMRLFLILTLLSCLHPVSSLFAQEDWDNYIMEVNRKPVSVVVDLGLKKNAPMADRPNVVIVRVQLAAPESNGQPGKAELGKLELMENGLENTLRQQMGAIYAGRFTQRGIRELYFYVQDTLGFREQVGTVMAGFRDYPYLCQAREDRSWTNYLQVLYPSDKDLEIIMNRRLVDELSAKGDGLTTPRRIDHFFRFPSQAKREEFLRARLQDGYLLENMDVLPEGDALRYTLRIHRDDTPSYAVITSLFLPLWEAAKKSQGRYTGWETFVVR
jgi:uncharacterized protein (TIGR01619 family)